MKNYKIIYQIFTILNLKQNNNVFNIINFDYIFI